MDPTLGRGRGARTFPRGRPDPHGRSGESLNAHLLGLLQRDVARPTVQEVLDRAARRAERAQDSAVDALDEERAGREDESAPSPR